MRKLCALVATFFMLFSFVGCSSEGTTLLKEIKQTTTWEASSQSGDMTFEVVANGETFKLGFDYVGYSLVEELKAEMTISPKTVEVGGVSIDLTQEEFKISPLTVYVDGTKMYISTQTIKDVCKVLEVCESEVGLDLSKEYILIDMATMSDVSGADLSTMLYESMQNVTTTMFDSMAALNVNIPIKQEGRKYTVEMTSDQMTEAYLGLCAHTLDAQKSIFEKSFKEAGLTEEEINEALTLAKAQFTAPEMVAAIKEMLKGSTAKVVYTYEDNKVVSNLDTTIKLNVEADSVSFGLKTNDTCEKAAVKAITMPTSFTTLDFTSVLIDTVEEASEVEAPTAENTASETEETANTAA